MIDLEIREDKPSVKGMYVIYVNDHPEVAYANRIFMFWDGDRWCFPFSDQHCRLHVYGWIGPLPAMPLVG